MWKRWVGVVAALAASIYLMWDDEPTCDKGCLRGARVLITGASSGIGSAVALEFARRGARVAITARRHGRLMQLSEDLHAAGAPDVTVLPGSMEELHFARAVVRDAVRAMGGLDYLILNHVGLTPISWWAGDVEATDQLVRATRLNFLSFAWAASEALGPLETSGGNILAVSSLCGKVPTPLVSPYAASKFALEGFFGSLRQELKLRHSNVSITIATLGYINTDTAVSQVQGRMLGVEPAPVGPCAEALVDAACARVDSLVHPGVARVALLLQRWAPGLLLHQLQAVYNITALGPPPTFSPSGP
uniref:Hydroxysteroid 11-beta-dehydrogenase 1-like protein n=1 Tax=Petromyzon marinus TaxID=7757 RepID=A0AAJ7UJ86_PETMA|nr:hydroxysteroid 11-beta-dehydrogenase 1-like protein [Petromyzon marinus]